METDSTNSFPNIDKYLYNEFYATDTSFEKSLDLDAFFGYRKDKSGEIIKEDPDHKPNRIFISKLDMFNTLHIAQFFSKRKYGDTLVGEEGEGEEEGGEEEEEPGEGGKEGEGDEVKEKNDSKSKIPSESKLKEKTKKASIDVESLFENFTEYEYIDALYAKYDVSKLNVLEYGELLNLDNHEERLLYLEKKFGVLKKKYLVDSSTSIEQLITEKKPKKGKQTSMYYELVGTIADSKQEAYYREVIPCLVEILSYNQTDERHYLSRLMKCGGYVFDITQNPAVINEARFVLNAIVDKFMYLEETSPKEFPTMNIKIAFILISPLMTWAATKPIDPEEPDLPFTEKDFKKRKPHPNYKDHFELEKELYTAVLKYPNKLKGYVIGTGGIYGYEETFLHYLFKLAWLNEAELPVLGKGKNKIPLIHIDDLAMIVHLIISNLPKNKYVFAIEKSVSTLKEVTKAVSKVLGSGRVGKVPKEHAFLIPEITQPFYDLLTANFNMESNVLDELNMPWRTEQGFVDNIKQLVKEYKAARKLKAIKILVVGPPGGGKTRVSKKLSEYYQINYITLQKGIETFMHNLKSKIAATEKRIADKARLEEEKRLKAENKPNEEEGEEEEEPVEEEEDDEDEEEADDESALEGLKEKLAAAQQKIESSGGQLEDEDAIRFVKATLTSRPCQNQGYVLDGYPTTLKQTVALFSIGGEGEEEAEEVEEEEEPEKNENENEGEGEEAAEAVKINKKTIPDIVICLEACDDHLYKTLLRHPEVVKQKVSEQDIFNSIRKYRKMNTTESTLLLFFDELERYPYILNVEHDKTADLDKVMERILTLVGQPCNYEAELLKQLQQKQKQDAARKYHEAKCQKQKHIRTLRKEAIKKKLEMWAAEVDRMKEEEEEILAKESVPLRHYLIKFIFPTLTNGLIEVARVQPEDPIDYLAEFLFKENPDGRMFLEDREEPTEIKKMINMLFDFKNYLQYTTHNTDVSSFIHDKP